MKKWRVELWEKNLCKFAAHEDLAYSKAIETATMVTDMISLTLCTKLQETGQAMYEATRNRTGNVRSYKKQDRQCAKLQGTGQAMYEAKRNRRGNVRSYKEQDKQCTKLKETGEAMYVRRIIQVRSCNHCCSRKVISIISRICVFLP